MFDLPKSTEIRKPIHKKLIYQKFASELSGDRKNKFDADISRIIITNEISEASVNIRTTEDISSIFVVQIELKAKEYSDRDIILISKLFGQRLLLVLHYEDKYQLAIYETKLLKSEWQTEDEINLRVSGLDMTVVWESLVVQVSGIEVEEGNSLGEQIVLEGEREKLQTKINVLEQRARKEAQSKKKFELFQEISRCKEELERLR